jgi:dipeptidase E
VSHPRIRRRLVLYSGGQERRNALIHESLLELAMRGRRARRRGGAVKMTYVPYTTPGARPFFQRFERRYRAFGATAFVCVAADSPALRGTRRARSALLRELHDSDIVYLAGGNTFEFLDNLRRSDLLPELARFHARGGVLAGLSAGALLLTPDIELAGYPAFDRDPNDVGIPRARLGALGLVDFDFFPHFRRSARYRDALAAWSRRSGRPVYACRDGSGIVVEGDCFTAHGEVWIFDRGHASRIGD